MSEFPRSALVAPDSIEAQDLFDAVGRYHGEVVYFVQAAEMPFVKIGTTNAIGLKGRVSSMQTGCPFKLNVRRVIQGSRDIERALHIKFAECRTLGEWFRLADDDLIAWSRCVMPRGLRLVAAGGGDS